VKHLASPDFWSCYHHLPERIQRLADANFMLLKTNPSHRSLHFKKIGKLRQHSGQASLSRPGGGRAARPVVVLDRQPRRVRQNPG
jgi:hypothetical protein